MLPICNDKGCYKTFRAQGINTLIERSKERGDDVHVKLQAIVNAHGDDAFIECHKTCYCSYTSKQNIAKYLSKKRKEDFATSGIEPCASRVRRSQLPSFQFNKHCLICGEECVPKDPKHPDRWDRVIQCETCDRPGRTPFKNVLLDICDQRNDDLGRQVEIRIKGALTDLPAADAQYHKRCYDDFVQVPRFSNLSSGSCQIDDNALELLIRDMFRNQELRTWTTLELYDMYCGFGGLLSRQQMFTKLTTYLGDDIVVIRMEGCASVVGFRNLVGKSLKIVQEEAVDEDSVDAVLRQVTNEAKAVQYNSANYDLGEFTYNNTLKQTSPTLLHLISRLVSGGEVTKKSLSLSQAIQSHITGTRNQTTLGLAVKLQHRHGSSELIKLLHDHGFIVSYDEVIRFRKSAAKFVGDKSTVLHQAMGLTRRIGPIFGWFDNLDLLVSTPNGRRETHVMAHEFQQHPSGIIDTEGARPGVMKLVIPRLLKTEARSLRLNVSRSIPLQHYTGPKKVNPPSVAMNLGIPYTDVCTRNHDLLDSQQKDELWLNSLSSDQSKEWYGFNNQMARQEIPSPTKPATVYLFGPLIDAPPSHPDTVLTSLVYMKKSLVELGMPCANLSIDMQLYMAAQQIKWWEPVRFKDVILRPGAMHILMSFMGSIGSLMKGSGLDVLVGAAFGGLTGIMNGKAWVRAMRAFRMVSVALLEHFLQDGVKTFDEISEYMEKARQHPTGRHWVDNFLVPTLLAHQFLRAEREGKWLFQQLCLERMLPYFFSAGHVHYARYISWHLIEMRHLLPQAAKADLIAGAHVCRHNEGCWNAVSGDQFGEQTAIKIGKGGLKGMTLSPELVTEWIDAFPISVYLSDTMDHLYSEHSQDTLTQARHKEEGPKRQKLDTDDRGRISTELSNHSHPLIIESEVLYNIVNGQIAPKEVNVHDALVLGEKMSNSFRNALPSRFHGKISSPVKTMEQLKRGMKVGGKTVFDLEAIFLRILMVGQQRQLQLAPIFQYELCAVPPSLIDEYGCLRKGNKSALANRLGVQQPNAPSPDTVIVDAQQLLYHIVWPHGGDASTLAETMKQRLSRYPVDTEQVLVFDKYKDVSAKDHERVRRGGEGSTDYNLTVNSPLPKRQAILKNTHNKRELSRILSTFNLGERITIDSQEDGGFGHDEADVTMIAYLLQAAEFGKTVIRILCDDTDVFVLLVYWVWKMELHSTCIVQMERWNGVILDINETCLELGPKCLQLPGMHALSGCDTVSYPFGIGKISALNAFKIGDFPGLYNVLGEMDSTHAALMETGKHFFAAIYGQPPGSSMSEARYKMYSRKKGKPMRIMALPPTESNLLFHVRRAHLQMILWKAADQQSPPQLDITQFGWEMKDGILSPSFDTGPAAPPGLIDVISCGCKSGGKSCSTERCSCQKNTMSCTIYCTCTAGDECCNPHTVRDDMNDMNDEEHDLDDDEYDE